MARVKEIEGERERQRERERDVANDRLVGGTSVNCGESGDRIVRVYI